jgi:D-glycero-beta-D-manno-heptose 1-phosphate adenylyltransferase
MDYLAHIESKIIAQQNLIPLLNQWRVEEQRLVFTNGCFDLLHDGHIQYLAQAKKLGTKLIIGLNSDASTQRLKGRTRPINNERTRSLMLAALLFTDAIVTFEEDTPLELIKKIQPDVLVKGGDYNVSTIVGADIVHEKRGIVTVIPFLEGYSTTKIEEKIRKIEVK